MRSPHPSLFSKDGAILDRLKMGGGKSIPDLSKVLVHFADARSVNTSPVTFCTRSSSSSLLAGN
jgi:hypothetical protein